MGLASKWKERIPFLNVCTHGSQLGRANLFVHILSGLWLMFQVNYGPFHWSDALAGAWSGLANQSHLSITRPDKDSERWEKDQGAWLGQGSQQSSGLRSPCSAGPGAHPYQSEARSPELPAV